VVEIDEARREAHDESGGEEAAGRGERQLARGSLPPTSLLLLLLLLLVGLLRCLCFFLLVPTPPPSFSSLVLLVLVLVQCDGSHCGPRTTSCAPQRPQQQQQQQQQRQRAGSEGATRTKSDELSVIFGVRGERDTRVAQWRAWARP